MQKIEPRIRGFLCTTAHPLGCAADVDRQIAQVAEAKSKGAFAGGPKRALIVGASGGYGLASRIAAAFGFGAATVGVFFERGAEGSRTASPGWYKTAAFTQKADAAGLHAANFNGDAFSADIKAKVCDFIAKDKALGQIDLLVYSLAAPARQLPDGRVAKSALKPIGKAFAGQTIDFNTGELRDISLDPASEEEVADTIKVMGGEDWEAWVQALAARGLLAEGAITTNYTYLGSEVTWPIYHHGTIGQAKQDLDRAAKALAGPMAALGGKAYVVVMKGLLTQAASAIPGMSIYLSLLFRAMKDAGTHEGCIEQTSRLMAHRLYGGDMALDDEGRIRMDDYEMDGKIQDYIKAKWSAINAENLHDLTDFAGYRQAFLEMHGFGFPGVDYGAEVDPAAPLRLAN